MEDLSTGSAKLSSSKYTPPKEWQELSDSEKIERLREVIKNLQRHVGTSQVILHQLKNSFKKHSHLEGNVVEPYNEYTNASSGLVGEANSISNYF